MHSSGFKYIITRCHGDQLPLGIWYPSDGEEKVEFFGPYVRRRDICHFKEWLQTHCEQRFQGFLPFSLFGTTF